ncbi:MAG: SDR family oxidoreductase, partial [Candidatus Wildermuthbacteria bacterium]|nr:SDR family oxidoreductase [Candidatus Wildermuthbacteria bacterium]
DEWAGLGITVNAVAPGGIDTPMIDPFRSDMDDTIKARVPMKRMGRPEEVSAVVAFLASEEASYVTGATYVVDGGYLAT